MKCISHTHSHWAPHGSPKTTIDTPKVAAFCFDSLLALACDPPIKTSLCRAVFCSFLPHLNQRWAYCTYSGPKTTRDTPKVAVFCFFRLLMLVCDPPIEISLCRAVFCSSLPHLCLRWAYRTPTAIEDPRAAPK